MNKFLPITAYSLLLILIFSLNLFLLKKILKYFNKDLNNRKRKLIIFSILILLDISGIILGVIFKIELLLKISAILNMIFIFANLSVLGSFPFMFLYLKLLVKPKKANKKLSEPKSKSIEKKITRRDFIKKGVFTIPLVALATSSVGVFEGFLPVKFRHFSFNFKTLPKNFNNMKIAHISDLHLGFFVRIDDLKKIVNKLNDMNIDLVLITGDFVDDYVILDEAIELIKKVKTKYGIFASIGNHEYYRGVKPVIKAFEKHEVELLINRGLSIQNNGKKIFIGGVDDPRRMKGDIKPFLENSLKKVLNNFDNEDFKIILSHRPTVLSVTDKYSIDLILSGHTHGGQVGFAGKSLFESIYPKKFLWGKYKIKNTILYTTSGAGHWFPFRISCPTEIPIITLKRKA